MPLNSGVSILGEREQGQDVRTNNGIPQFSPPFLNSP